MLRKIDGFIEHFNLQFIGNQKINRTFISILYTILYNVTICTIFCVCVPSSSDLCVDISILWHLILQLKAIQQNMINILYLNLLLF